MAKELLVKKRQKKKKFKLSKKFVYKKSKQRGCFQISFQILAGIGPKENPGNSTTSVKRKEEIINDEAYSRLKGNSLFFFLLLI